LEKIVVLVGKEVKDLDLNDWIYLVMVRVKRRREMLD
jgi:hypothetical protein